MFFIKSGAKCGEPVCNLITFVIHMYWDPNNSDKILLTYAQLTKIFRGRPNISVGQPILVQLK